LDRYRHLSEKIATVKKEERRKGTFRVLYCGEIEKRYEPDVVVRAVARLSSDIPGVELRYLGDDFSTLFSIAAAFGVDDRVTYVESVSSETMIEEILTADVAVVPARRNSYSELVHTNEMYEYIALETPVVISRLDSVAAYFPEESLVFFEPGDAEDLAERLRYVFAHPEEMNLRVERAKEILETYRWDREKKKYLGVYRSLLSL
jgi:glycosyltransferase involved in cell wall biosynthesis